MRSACALLCAVVLAAPALAQDGPPPQEPATPAGPAAQATPGNGLAPYDRIVTKDAKSTTGVFTIHRIKERLLYEIPKAMLDREFLLVSQIARTTEGAGYGGQEVANRVVKWQRHGDRVLLRGVSYRVVATPGTPIAKAVEAANYDAILMSFPVQAVGKDDAPVIDVGRLFTSDVPELSARTHVRARLFDGQRSFIERAVVFPRNIEVEATHTFNTPPDSPPMVNGRPGPVGSASVLMHFSMVLLPERPMRARLFDERVGYFSVRQLDFGLDEPRAPVRRSIRRWRLEKQDPSAAVSDPVTPITFYVDPATPAKWVPWIKKGVEAWQGAFEAAGFRHAIVAKDAPSPADDPEWSPEDARYSVLRWLPSTVENAFGPSISDPRTGEILEADIQLHQNMLNMVRDWYLVQASPLDPRAQHLPLPDDLMGQLLQMVVTHEVGHSIGLQHNMKASAMYPAEKVRDKAWVKQMGFTPSIMDYARMNYVAQPEDGFEPADLIPRIGPYDVFAIKWGYAPVTGAATPEAERSALDTLAREQDTTPWLRFTTPDANGSDPADQMEAIGDADPVSSTRLGLKNLARVSAGLVTMAAEPGEPYDTLDELYARMVAQWRLELGHVVGLIGGVRTQQKHNGQTGLRFTPVPKPEQTEAVAFLLDEAFRVPPAFLSPEILRRIEPSGAVARMRQSQVRMLETLLGGGRLLRLAEQEALEGAAAYGPLTFLGDVRKGLWREVYAAGAPKVDAFRRNLQRAHVDILAERVSGRTATADDVRAFFRGELKTLDADLKLARLHVTDRETAMHLDDVRAQIAKALDPAAAPPAAPATPARPVGAAVDDPEDLPLTCWQDDAAL